MKEKNKICRGRFKKPLDHRVAHFNSSIGIDLRLYMCDIYGSKAHVKMLARQHIITSKESIMICDALDEIEKEISDGEHMPLDEHEDVHMFIEQLLISKIGDVGKKMHTARSRNDQVAVDLRLYIRDASINIKNMLQNLCEMLDRLSQKHCHDVMPGYTHLQQAQPVMLGAYFDAYFSMFKRDIGRLDDWYIRMNACPLGACALAGTTLNIDRKLVAMDLQFDSVIENTIDAVSDRDYVIEFCSFASIMMMHLSRISEDLIVWCTQEFNFVELDDSFATGSSIMPNKKNPDVLELIRGKSGRVFGNLMAILTIMKSLPLAYNKDMQEDKECVFDTLDTIFACLNVITPFLESLRFNVERMKHLANDGYLNATKFMEELVSSGVPFRDAHNIVGQMISDAMSNGVSLDTLIVESKKDKKI